MPAPDITPLPSPPLRTATPATFSTDAENFVAALPTLVTQINEFGDYLDAYVPTGGISDAPSDGKTYGRKNGAWSEAGTGGYQRTTITATAGQTSFTAAYVVGEVSVFLNGVLLNPTDYTATTGNTVVLASAAAVGDLVDVIGATLPSGYAGLIAANNLSELTNPATARSNLGLLGMSTTADAPSDGTSYVRKNGAWVAAPAASGAPLGFAAITFAGSPVTIAGKTLYASTFTVPWDKLNEQSRLHLHGLIWKNDASGSSMKNAGLYISPNGGTNIFGVTVQGDGNLIQNRDTTIVTASGANSIRPGTGRRFIEVAYLYSSGYFDTITRFDNEVTSMQSDSGSAGLGVWNFTGGTNNVTIFAETADITKCQLYYRLSNS